MTTVDEMVARAIGDPGSMIPRKGDETTTQWTTRAVMEIIQVFIGVDQDAHYAGTPAMRALMENADLRDRLRVADDLLHDANGIICNAEDNKFTLPCLDVHCVERNHTLDLDNPQPIGDQEWKNAARRWATTWHSFMDSDRPMAWRGPDEGDIKLPPPPPPPPSSSDDLAEMRSALAFAAGLLRTEMGPGGFMEREPEAVRATWMSAIECLESADTVPMIPLYEWRMRNCPHGDARRKGTHTRKVCQEMQERAGASVRMFTLQPSAPADCGSRDGLHGGTCTLRSCVGEPSAPADCSRCKVPEDRHDVVTCAGL